jgi:outer membrane beta-barrel protein
MNHLFFGFIAMCLANVCFANPKGKAVDGETLILEKQYPLEGRSNLDFSVGSILNQSYVNSYLLRGEFSHHWSESWGIGATISKSINSDKDSRTCIEEFYNDPEEEVSAECRPGDTSGEQAASSRANLGPAYVPVREIDLIATADFIWSPVYGKQIVLMSATGHFDVNIIMGGGFATSNYYDLQTNLRGTSRSSRGTFAEEESDSDPGTTPEEQDSEGSLYGIDGRPTPEKQTHPLINIGLAQRFNFARRFSIKAELRNYTLLGTPNGFENFMSLMGGIGVRF